jgi:hypothetical protein
MYTLTLSEMARTESSVQSERTSFSEEAEGINL